MRQNPNLPKRTAALCVTLVVFVGGCATLRSTSGPADRLVLVAERMSEVSTARLTMEATVEMDVSFAGVSFPEGLGEVPEVPELPPGFSEAFPEAFGGSLEELVEQLLGPGLERGTGQIQSFLEDGLSYLVDIVGEGSMAVPDRVEMEGTVRPGVGTDAINGPVAFAVILIGDDAWFRLPDGGWVAAPGHHGPFGPLTIQMDDITRVLRDPVGPVQEVGTEVIDGETTSRYRFEFEADTLVPAPAEVTWTVEVWVGVDDDIVRRFDVLAEGAFEASGAQTQLIEGVSGDWSASSSVRLSDFGVEVDIQPPRPDQVRETQIPENFAFLYPFGGRISVSSR